MFRRSVQPCSILSRTGTRTRSRSCREAAQPRVVVRAEAIVRAERVGHLRQRLLQILRQQRLVRHVGGNLAQAVHVVREAGQAASSHRGAAP